MGVAAAGPWGTTPARYGQTGALTSTFAFRRTLLEQCPGGFSRLAPADSPVEALDRPGEG